MKPCNSAHANVSLITDTLQTHVCSVSQSNWSRNDFPKSLTNSVNLTLEVPSFSMDVKDEETHEGTVPDMGIPKESNYSNTTDPIPIQQSSEHRLLKAQKHTRNSLAKCISAVFTIYDVTVCEELSLGAENLYNLTVSSTQSSDGSDLPSFPLLQKEYRKKMRMQEKARRSVIKYKMHKQGHKPVVNLSDIVL